MVEALRRSAISLTFDVNVYCYRGKKGSRLIEVLADGHQAPDIERWLNRARNMSSLELAEKLGVSDRHARRIKSGEITASGLRSLTRNYGL